MAVQIDKGRTFAARLEYLDERVGYADFEMRRNAKWSQLMTEVAEEKGQRALQWQEEKDRLEREREELIGALRVH